jgi:hypothetical protein
MVRCRRCSPSPRSEDSKRTKLDPVRGDRTGGSARGVGGGGFG